MKKDDLIDAIGKIDAKYVTEAEEELPVKKPNIKIWLSAVACVAILAISLRAFDFSGGSKDMAESADMVSQESAEDAELTADKAENEEEDQTGQENAEMDQADGVMADTADELAADIVINEENSMSKTEDLTQGAASENGFFDKKTMEELIAYYEYDVVPEKIPEDLTIQSTSDSYGIWYEDQEKTKVLSDANTFVWENTSGNRSLSILITTEKKFSYEDFAENDAYKSSDVNGKEVTVVRICQAENNHLVAQYRSGSNYIEIDGMNLSEEEFKSILLGL